MRLRMLLKWSLIGLSGFAIVAVNVWMLGGSPWNVLQSNPCRIAPDDPSMVLCEPNREPNVENGWAHDVVALELGTATRVVLPAEARVKRIAVGEPPRLLLHKYLWYTGRTQTQLSIRETRKQLGCAYRRDGTTLIVATFGDWEMPNEGGAAVNVFAFLPHETAVEFRDGLSGATSAANGEREPGWTKLVDVPDPTTIQEPYGSGERSELMATWTVAWRWLALSALAAWFGFALRFGWNRPQAALAFASVGLLSALLAFAGNVYVGEMLRNTVQERTRANYLMPQALGYGFAVVFVSAAAFLCAIRPFRHRAPRANIATAGGVTDRPFAFA